MSRKRKQRCMDPNIANLLADYRAGAFDAPGREEDKATFWAHVRECGSCRDAVINHGIETVAIPMFERFAHERGISFEQVMEAFGEIGKKIERNAQERGIPVKQALKEYLDQAEQQRQTHQG